jgi:hypothetical protein
VIIKVSHHVIKVLCYSNSNSNPAKSLSILSFHHYWPSWEIVLDNRTGEASWCPRPWSDMWFIVVRSRWGNFVIDVWVICSLPPLQKGAISLRSVCLSVCPSVAFMFFGLFPALLEDVQLKFDIWLSWIATDEVWVFLCLTYIW